MLEDVGVGLEVFHEKRVDEGVRAADDDGEAIPAGDVVDDVGSAATEVDGGELREGGVDVAEEVVGDVAALREGDLVGGDVESAVDLHFVGVDDFGDGEEGGEVDGETGLAGAGGAHDDNDLVLAAVEGGVHARPPLYGMVTALRLRLQYGKPHKRKKMK